MRRPLGDHVVVAGEAHLRLHGDAARRHLVLVVAGHAADGVDALEIARPTRIVEIRVERVGVLGQLGRRQLMQSSVRHRREAAMAGVAGGFEQVVAIRGLAGQEEAAVTGQKEGRENDEEEVPPPSTFAPARTP